MLKKLSVRSRPQWKIVTCLDFVGGDGSFGVSKDGVDGDHVLGAQAEALDHVEVERVAKVYVLDVAVCGNTTFLHLPI